MSSSRAKVLQYLQEAGATEAALANALGAHIAMTPAGEYRDLLEHHRQETKDQGRRIAKRLDELGVSESLGHVV